jgi:hypothetical protein
VTAVRFAVFLLRSPEAGRSHDAAAVTIPPLTFNVRQSCTPRVGLCAVDVAQVAAAAMALIAGRTTPPLSEPLLAVLCARRARCRDRHTGVTEPGVLDVGAA